MSLTYEVSLESVIKTHYCTILSLSKHYRPLCAGRGRMIDEFSAILDERARIEGPVHDEEKLCASLKKLFSFHSRLVLANEMMADLQDIIFSELENIEQVNLPCALPLEAGVTTVASEKLKEYIGLYRRPLLELEAVVAAKMAVLKDKISSDAACFPELFQMVLNESVGVAG